ncbi:MULTISPECIES: DUF3515 domain-containing protein [unclassified Streptomyces]|uniref:DUF3515 domain-containing protein n=1 Tax=unclassified Streptomyces TaxID=2593676 RepID=UPI0021562DBB|nr:MULTISPECIES: DUF3515 domain-containing protein [unclassified Streptomyces]
MTSTVRRLRHLVPALPMVAFLVSCGPSSTVSVESPRPEGEAAEACDAVLAALPERVEDEESREVPGDAEYVAAWGDPAITLRCGVERPAALTPGSETYRPTSDAIQVNDVSWLLEQQADGYRFTTTERTVYVEVEVPGAYAPEVDALVDVAEAVHANVPYDPLWEQYYEGETGADSGTEHDHGDH